MALFLHSGLYKAFHAVLPDRLTVLAYHRVTDPHAPGFDTFKPTISATPEAFAAQMDFLRHHFSVVTISQVVAWLRDHQPLPLHPALITFDDGYRDNFDHALPILQHRDLPAVIYLATDCIESISPFYWDLVAYCFHHTHRQRAALPLSGQQEWHDERSRTTVMMDWLDTLKTLPNAVQSTAVGQLPRVLGVSVPVDAFAGLYLTWDQIRTMVAAGIDMGAHTQSHAIMTRVSPETARQEILGSKARIEAEIGRPVVTFAYPNGSSVDFNRSHQTILQQAGFEAAFTLLPGPAYLSEVRHAPLAIRRVCINHRDTLSRFVVKVLGVARSRKRPG